MVPRPRVPKGLDRAPVVRDRPLSVRPHLASAPRVASGLPPVALTRTPQGWAVVAPCGAELAGDLVEGMTLADLVMEDLGGTPEPERSARRSARGAVDQVETADPRDTRIAALERTVAQLEHALAARVATERAIGVLVERYHVSPRDAFDALRQEARASSRAVQELAREVLDGTSDPGERLCPSAAEVDWPATAAGDGRS